MPTVGSLGFASASASLFSKMALLPVESKFLALHSSLRFETFKLETGSMAFFLRESRLAWSRSDT